MPWKNQTLFSILKILLIYYNRIIYFNHVHRIRLRFIAFSSCTFIRTLLKLVMEKERIIKIEDCRYIIHDNKRPWYPYLNLSAFYPFLECTLNKSNTWELIDETNLTLSPCRLAFQLSLTITTILIWDSNMRATWDR